MNRRLFPKIVYFVFTFSIGILLALFLPYMLYLENGDAVNVTAKLIEQGNYVDAMKMAGGYFNGDVALSQQLENGGGIVLFEAATLIESEPIDDKEVGDKLHKAFAGFLFGVDDYQIYSTENNQSKIVVTDADGNSSYYSILNWDVDGNESYDTNATFTNRGFIYLDFGLEDYSSFKSLTLVDKNGNDYATVSLENLNVSAQFFANVQPFRTHIRQHIRCIL